MPTLQYALDRGFAPDLPLNTPGILVDTDQCYPTPAGYRPFAQLAAESGHVILKVPQGSYFTEYSDLTDAIICGTADRLYRYNTPLLLGFTDISNGQSFGPLTTERWHYTTFGNDIIAVNGVDTPQLISKTTGLASPITGAPKGSIVEAAGNFVFICNSTLGGGDDVNWCGIGNDQDWTPDIATQAGNQILGDTPGPITAAKALGQNNILLYKNRAVYLGTYMGPPVLWSFTLLSNQAGALSQESVVTLDGAQVMIGSGEFYTCDGSPPRVLDTPLRKWFFEISFNQANGLPIAGWDKFHETVVWHYLSGSSQVVPSNVKSRYICWHPSSNRWTTGLFPNQIRDVVLPYVRVSSTGAMSGPINSNFTAPFYGMAVFLGDRNLYSFSGDAAPAYIITGDQGDTLRYSFIPSFRPTFKVYPAGNNPQVGTQQPSAAPALCTPLYRYNEGDTQYAGPEAQLTQYGAFPVRQSARFHAARIDLKVDCELVSLEADFVAQGTR